MKRFSPVLALTLALLATLLTSGCIAKVPHSPHENLLGEIGFEAAAAEFEQLTNGLRTPEAYDARVNSEGFVYHFAGAYSLYWGAVPIADGSLRILWKEIARVDIYENAKVFLIDRSGGRVGHEYLFHSVPEATRWADLIASFRAGPPPEDRPGDLAPNETESSPWAEEERDRRSGAPR